MNTLTIIESHNLSGKHVKERLANYLNELITKNEGILDDAKLEWKGNQGSFKFQAAGMNFSGQIQVEEQFVTFKGNLPPIASDYYNQIEEIIRYEIYRLLN